MAPVRPRRVAGARAPRAVGASLAVGARLVPRHGRGGGRRGAAALPDATRLRVVGGGAAEGAGDAGCWGRGRGLLAQVGLGRLLHGCTAPRRCAHGQGEPGGCTTGGAGCRRAETGSGAGSAGRAAVAVSSSCSGVVERRASMVDGEVHIRRAGSTPDGRRTPARHLQPGAHRLPHSILARFAPRTPATEPLHTVLGAAVCPHGRITVPAQTRRKQLSIACVACIPWMAPPSAASAAFVHGNLGAAGAAAATATATAIATANKHSPALRTAIVAPGAPTMTLWHHGLRATDCRDASCYRKRDMDGHRCSLQTARCPIANVLQLSHSTCD